MKAQSSYFRRKNSKQGLALSTSMAICIVLAILVAVLVSMASLNITTTQATVNQREAYIQAKSALAFAESYYSQHDIPGKDAATGEALIVFNDTVVSNGAKVYVTKDGSTAMEASVVQELRDKCLDTYVDVLKSGKYLDLTAHCKYGDSNYYELSREFYLGNDDEVQPNSFTGNVSYQATSDTRYLRIHVRTNPAFNGYPYLYAWYTTVNKDDGDEQYGRSSIVNKMSEDTTYAKVENGAWLYNEHDPTDPYTNGPVGDCAMQYEGNGWYVTKFTFSTDQHVNFINAIVTKDGAPVRASGNDQQSWEFFGIPVPGEDKAGEKNGLDVYITLNRNQLLDAREGAEDEFTQYYNSAGSVNNFAKFCGSWYTVYTKKDTATMHYRKQGVYDDSAGPGGDFEYEGYGWWRCTSNNFNDTVAGISFGSAHTIDHNVLDENKEVIKEGFVCEFDDGTVQLYDYESDANDAFAAAGEGEKAGDYVTINVKSSRQPVDAQVNTEITYSSKWDKSDGSSPDPDPTPDPETTASSTKDELKFQKLASSAWGAEYALIGDDKINNWGLDNSGDHRYENLGGDKFKFTNVGSNIFELSIEDCVQDSYTFKVIEVIEDSGSIDADVKDGKNGWAFAYGSGNDTVGNTVFDIKNTGNTMKIVFNGATHEITVSEENPDTPVDGSIRYAIIGWENDWGLKSSEAIYSAADFAATDDMTFYEDSGVYQYVSKNPVFSGTEYTFKIIYKRDSEGTITDDDWAKSYGNGTDDVVFTPPEIDGEPATYNAVITFDSRRKNINVDFKPTGVAGENFYLIGNYNNWGSNHTFNKATSSIYQLESTGTTDAKGRYIYKLTPSDALEAGDYEVKVISSKSLKEGADGDSEESINYEHSWGEKDDSGITYGSSRTDDSNREGLKFSIANRANIEFTFSYNPSSFNTSEITYVEKTVSNVKTVRVKFYNAQGKDSSGELTKFTTPWTELYVTYTTKGNPLPKCVKVDFSSGTKTISCNIPEDTEKFYFSNMDSTLHRGETGYEYTEEITYKKGENVTFRPVDSTDESDGKKWSVTNTTNRSVDDITETGTMVYTGSSQNNYYDAPLVKVLNMIVSGKPEGNGTKYAFAAYPYKNFDVPGVGKITFNVRNYITYQGEKYYYIAGKSYSGGSFLVVQDSTKSKGGILRESDMALVDAYGGVAVKMNNRGGGVFTSDQNYYDGSQSPFNYGGYTPNWYTYKVKVTTKLKIESIKGVVSNGETIVDSPVDYFEPANAADNYKQPLYIVQEYKNTSGDEQIERYYTYNTNIGNVDTNTSNKVSVYFANSGSGDNHFDKVSVYAYDPLGNSTTKELSKDATDADHSYYKFEYDSGKYCYFQFFDPTTGSNIEDATKKTKPLYLTGNEDENTRAYDILALDGSSEVFTPYIHPKTQALYAAISLESAAAAARIPAEYSYNVATGEYTALGAYSMSELDNMAKTARNYADNGSGGKWSATDPSAYNQLATTVQEFVRTIQKARIYIADEVPEVNPASTDTNYTGERVFKEGSYKDDTIKYQERWVSRLTNVYNTAVAVFDNPSQQTDVSYLQSCIDNINNLISAPLTDWNTEAVQIIVDDQIMTDTDSDTGDTIYSGGWGKSNIHLYTCDELGNNWKEVGYDLYDTTQSDEGFYAYVFKLKLDTNNYMVAKSLPADGSDFLTLDAGQQYIFQTASNSFKKDDSILTYRITDDKIEEGTETGAYNDFKIRSGDDAFVLYFIYDTKVKYSGGDYTIRAGAYTISSAYPGFGKDFLKSGETVASEQGINLFTANAKKFFENPANYGMSDSSSTSYTTWSDDILDSGTNIDLMINRISKSSQISASTSANKKIGLRYKAEKGDDTLKLGQKVSLDGGTVTIAANKINLNSYDFAITAKTIVFQTDTIVTTSHGEVKIAHGTYSFNTSGSATTFTASLQSTGTDSDWRKNYTRISESGSKLKGGYYIAHQ